MTMNATLKLEHTVPDLADYVKLNQVRAIAELLCRRVSIFVIVVITVTNQNHAPSLSQNIVGCSR